MDPVIKINPGATKSDIREKVWNYMEDNNLANFPRPVHHRIPNFKGAFLTCAKVSELQEFAETTEIKVDPEKPLEGVRLTVLQAQKTLLVPTPRLHSGLFNKITPPEGASKEELRVCASSQGVRDFSVPVGLDSDVKVDLVVVGSVAVSEKGFRIGKGEGFADLEYGMMASMGAVNKSTVVVTVVHDCQVLDFSEDLMGSHDLTVDYILTPTRVIKTNCEVPKPQGIIWLKLDTGKLEKIPILKMQRALDEKAGKDVTLGEAPEPSVQSTQPKRQSRWRSKQNSQQEANGESRQEPRQEVKAESEQKGGQRTPLVRKESKGDGKGGNKGEARKQKMVKEKSRGRMKEQGDPQEQGGEATPQREQPSIITTVYLGGIPTGLRVSELKTALREREVVPLKLTWHGAQHRAFLDYIDPQAANHALKALQGLCLNDQNLLPELAKSQRGAKKTGEHNRRSRPPPTPKPKTAPLDPKSDTD